MARDTLIFLLQNLGFLINEKKSQFQPVQQIEFLGVNVDSMKMELTLPSEKVNKIICQCKDLLDQNQVSILQLTKLLGKLTSTAVAVLPAPLHYRHIQRDQIKNLLLKKSYQAYIVLSEKGKEEITWWMENLRLCNGKTLLTIPPNLTISSDASKIGWGRHARGCQRVAPGPGKKPEII